MTYPKALRKPFFTALLISAISTITFAERSVAAGTDIYLEIMAHDWSITAPVGFSPGHAFMCIGLRLSSGIKEDCYGFFKALSKGGIISGPGVVLDQGDDPKAVPARFSRVTVTVKHDITAEQRRLIIAEAEQWSTHHYDLTKENCIDFVAAAARLAGWSVPARQSTDTPESWVKKLRDANERH